MKEDRSKIKYRCGYVALMGKPNVGKSTILNKVLGKKVSITAKKPQTTQKQILGIKTADHYQMIFVDTPGLHENLYKHENSTLTKYMGRAAQHAAQDVDLILFVISGTKWTEDDLWALNNLMQNKTDNTPVALVINKLDNIKNKKILLPFVKELQEKYNFTEIFYISALKSTGLERLESAVVQYLPVVEGKEEFYFASGDVTNQNDRLRSSEIIREKIIRLLGSELPYSSAIEIEKFSYDKTRNNLDILKISAVIWVERNGQKIIIIGSDGEKIKQIGQTARIDLEKLFDMKVHLQLWVKIKSNWSSNEKILKSLGFNDYTE